MCGKSDFSRNKSIESVSKYDIISGEDVLTFIKYSKDPVRLEQALKQDPDFKYLGREEVNVLNACVNAKLKFTSEESEGLDVCEAIEIMKEEAAAEAAAEATRIAEEKAAAELEKVTAEAARIAEERAAAEREESEKYRIASLIQLVKNLMRNKGWTSEQAIEGMGLTGKDRAAVVSGLG